MIADSVRTYLEGERVENASLLLWATNRLGRRLYQQTMSRRAAKDGLTFTDVTKACARQAAYKLRNVKGEPMSYRTAFTFWTGDALEVAVMVAAELAGVKIEGGQEEVEVCGVVDEEQVALAGHPDGWIVAAGDDYGAANGKHINVEIKSMSSYAFEKAVESEKIDDAFGYATQASLEVAGWRARGLDIDLTEFVCVNKNTGEVASVLERYQPALVEMALSRAKAATDSEPESIGKIAAPNGKLALLCRYCEHRKLCHGEAAK